MIGGHAPRPAKPQRNKLARELRQPHCLIAVRNRTLRPIITKLFFGALLLGLGGQAQAQTQLLYLTEDVPVSLDPDGPSSTVNTSQVGRINMLEPLIGYAMKGTNDDGVRIPDFTKFEGRLAESWDYDPATVTWTLHLRHGVIGCSGNEFTADDVLYTLARAKSVTGATTIAWFSGSVAGIKGFTADVFNGGDKDLGDAVTAVDPYTVKIKQGSPNAFFLLALSLHPIYMFDSKAMKAHSTPTDPWSHDYANTTSVDGFGPYCLERWVKGDEFVVRANEHYYRGKPPIERIVMKKVPQSSNRVVTLRSGQAGLIQGLTPREYAAMRGTKGVTVGGVYGNEALFIAPNLKSPVWGEQAGARGHGLRHRLQSAAANRICRAGAQMGRAGADVLPRLHQNDVGLYV